MFKYFEHDENLIFFINLKRGNIVYSLLRIRATAKTNYYEK